MKNLRARILVLCAVLAVGVLSVGYFTREPSADGRTLSEWLQIGLEEQFLERANPEVTNAVRQIGAKGIPVLLDKLRVSDPAWRQQLDKVLGGFPSRWASGYQHAEASYGFSILGTQAVSAIPELSKMLFDRDRDTAARSGYALGLIGSESLPVLRSALTNSEEYVREGGVRGITATRDVLRRALPEVLTLRHETNQMIALIILTRVGSLLPETESLPVAVEFLQDSRPHVQTYALRVMARVRTNSAVAFPWVLPFLTNSSAGVRMQASNTLATIDPSIAAAHGVNTNWDGGRIVR